MKYKGERLTQTELTGYNTFSRQEGKPYLPDAAKNA